MHSTLRPGVLDNRITQSRLRINPAPKYTKDRPVCLIADPLEERHSMAYHRARAQGFTRLRVCVIITMR